MRRDKRRSYTTAESNSSDIVFDITSRLKIPTASVNQNPVSRQVDYAAQGGLKRCPNSDLMPLLAIGY